MKVRTFENKEQWLEARKGLITGTKAGKLFSKRDKKPLQGYYELIAERIALPPTEENAMDRGVRLEDEAIRRFEKETKKKVDGSLVTWHRDDDEEIAISPDGFIGETEAVEVKCLDSANHIKAFLTKAVPSEYEAQTLQYFVVNEDLKSLWFVFYDPRMPKDIFWFEIKRGEVQKKVAEYLEFERKALEEIRKIEKQLTF